MLLISCYFLLENTVFVCCAGLCVGVLVSLCKVIYFIYQQHGVRKAQL